MACIMDKCQTLGSTLCVGGAAFASGLSNVAQTGGAAICQGAKITASFLSNGANIIAGAALSAFAALAVCFQSQAMIAAGFFAMHQAFLIPLAIGAAVPVAIFLVAAIATSCLRGSESREHAEALAAANEALRREHEKLSNAEETLRGVENDLRATEEALSEKQRNLGIAEKNLIIELEAHNQTRGILATEQKNLFQAKSKAEEVGILNGLLTAEKRELEAKLEGIKRRVSEQEKTIENLDLEIIRLKEGPEHAKTISALESDLQNARGEIENKDRQVEQLKKIYRELEEIKNRLESELKTVQTYQTQTELEYEKLNEALTLTKNQVLEQQKVIEQTQNAREAEQRGLCEKIEKLETGLQEVLRVRQSLEDQLQQATEELSQAKRNVSHLKSQLDQAIQERTETEKEMETLSQENEKLKKALNPKEAD